MKKNTGSSHRGQRAFGIVMLRDEEVSSSCRYGRVTGRGTKAGQSSWLTAWLLTQKVVPCWFVR